MLSRYDFQLEPEGELSYRMSSLFHGALLELLPGEYADFLHQSRLHPYAQHLERRGGKWHWVVNMLDDEAISIIGSKLKETTTLYLKKHDLRISLILSSENMMSDDSLNELFYGTHTSRVFNLDFKTPTAFKRQGKYLFYPDLFCLFQSLMQKHDAIYDKGFMDQEALEDMVSNTEIIRYDLRSTMFSLEGVQIPAFLGKIRIKVRGPETMGNFAHMLLRFGEFSGIGIKTAIGMGAYELAESFDDRKKGGSE